MPIYKDEKRGTWYCSFYYTDWTGKRKKKKKEGFKKQSEAKEFERDFLTKQRNNCDMSFEKLTELYLEHAKTNVRTTTFANKSILINNKIKPYFKNMNVTDITPNHIRKWQNALKNKSLSNTYLKSINIQLSAIFNFAIKYYGLSTSPALKAGSMGKNKAEDMKFWTIEEFKKFINFSDYPNVTIAFKILFWTGIRRGELLALTFNDIDLEKKTININKTYTKLLKKDVINPPKTRKSKRIISISDSLVEDIKEYINSIYDYNKNDRIFTFGTDFLRQHLIRICKLSKVKQIRIHDIRHSHASLLIELGFAPLAISERLGHESVQTTLNIYSHLYPNKDIALANKLNELYE
ncbi:tyrosine-type recombinase/integrase [Clostridium chromiireducens]|uniref:Putative prophage phiRv2 integrase n=1 Tax=Clostridium chromiireducens TaxID=225345 RepID=A0A1V4IKS7_9CLOT|nr:site-specific integrase [Clostridium chromiireducens]OPJ60469.1 putative prophage phiRv2 integrase [Clostridium chromiireducens]